MAAHSTKPSQDQIQLNNCDQGRTHKTLKSNLFMKLPGNERNKGSAMYKITRFGYRSRVILHKCCLNVLKNYVTVS